MSYRNRSRRKPGKAALFFKRTRLLWMLLGCVLIILFIALPQLSAHSDPNTPVSVQFEASAEPAQTSLPTDSLPTDGPVEQLPDEIMVPSADQLTELYTTLQVGDEDPAVSRLQQRLMELGYFDYDEVTEYFGTVTEDAVKLFQRTFGMEITGIADPRTQYELFSETAPTYTIKQGDQGSDVRRMQARLEELGYYTDKINGYFGAATQRAVLSFQRRNKLEQTGIITLDSRDLMYSPRARYLVDPTPTPTPKPTPTPTPTPKPKTTPKATPKSTKSPIYIPEVSSGGSASGNVSGLISIARQQLGKPYILSDEGPDSFDCSGLVYYCLRSVGVSTGRYNALGFSQVSKWMPVGTIGELQTGDLLFFKSDSSSKVNHAAIYVGGGQFVHASSSKGQVITSSFTDYYKRNFVIARRVF